MTGRVVSTASLLIDLPIGVAALPERGGDALGVAAGPTAGGGFNIVAAAARQGAEVALLSPLGTGSNGRLGRDALDQEGVAHIGRVDADADTGFCVTLIEADGERTFVTVPGAEAEVGPADLPPGITASGDIIFVSGYDLCYPGSGPALADWVSRLATDLLVVFDPGPLVAEIPAALLDQVLRRCDLCTLNEREAALLWGIDLGDDPAAAAVAQIDRLHARLRPGTTVLLRVGARGCLVIGRSVTAVPSVEVDMVDATGAGDAHAGVFMARLLAGDEVAAAVYAANIAAALTVTRRGPATSPTRRELADEIARVPEV